MNLNQEKKIRENNADTIKIEGSLEDGTYYSTNKNDFVERVEIKGTFINRVDATMAHACKVGFEGCITKTTPKENELEVEIVGIGYQGVAVPVTGVIPEHLIGDFQGRYTIGSTATLNIAILNVVTTKEVQQEVGFGEGLGEVITTTINKRIIFGGDMPKYQGVAGAISDETVKQGLALRQAKLEAKKEEAINKASGAGVTMDAGFGVTNVNFGTGVPTGSFEGMMPQGGFSGAQTSGYGGFPQ